MKNQRCEEAEYSRFPRRKNTRRLGYDYSKPGYHFVTICALQREMLFGDIVDGQMVRNSVAEVIQGEIKRLSCHYSNVTVDSWCIMPNHVHLLIHLAEFTGAARDDPGTTAPVLGNVIRGLKAGVSRRTGVHVWQRNYHDHIVRDASELELIREYIRSNPLSWEHDRHNPMHPKYHEWRDVPDGLQEQTGR